MSPQHTAITCADAFTRADPLFLAALGKPHRRGAPPIIVSKGRTFHITLRCWAATAAVVALVYVLVIRPLAALGGVSL